MLPHSQPLLNAALSYAVSGTPVFPLVAGGKRPLTTHGFKDATCNEDQIRAWWRTTPEANIGFPTGSASGLDVVDFDVKSGGLETLANLEGRFGQIPTRRIRTQTGGVHLYFRYDPHRPLPTRAGVLSHHELGGVDTRGEGGYVVAPPSQTAQGSYEVIINLEPLHCPDWLWELLVTPHKQKHTAQPASKVTEQALCPGDPARLTQLALEQAITDTVDGQGDDIGFRLALRLRDLHIPEPDAMRALEDYAVMATKDTSRPFTTQDARRWWHSANTRESRPISPGIGVPLTQRSTSIAWNDPVPLTDDNLPEFPVKVLPEPLLMMTFELSHELQVPLDLTAILGMGCIAACVQKKAIVEVRPGWRNPLNIYVVAALHPGEKKSPVVERLIHPILEFEREEAERLATVIADNRREREYLERRIKKLMDSAVNAKDISQAEGYKEQATQLDQQLSLLPIIPAPRLLTDDVTPEKLACILSEHGECQAIISAEGGIFDIFKGRYSDSGANLDIFLKSHSGENLRVDRIGRPPLILQNPALTLALAVQPTVINGLVAGNNSVLRGRGLLARFLYSLPQSLVGRRQIRPRTASPTTIHAWRSLVKGLLNIPVPESPYILRFSPEADAVMMDLELWLEPKLGQDGELRTISDWANKLAGACARLAGLIHFIKHYQGTLSQPLDRACAESAVELGRYFLAHALAAHSKMGADPMLELADRIARWLAELTSPEVKRTDITRKFRGSFKNPEELTRALTILLEHEYIREVPDDRLGPGRKASRYMINPRLSRTTDGENGNNGNNSSPAQPKANLNHFCHSIQHTELASAPSTAFPEPRERAGCDQITEELF